MKLKIFLNLLLSSELWIIVFCSLIPAEGEVDVLKRFNDIGTSDSHWCAIGCSTKGCIDSDLTSAECSCNDCYRDTSRCALPFIYDKKTYYTCIEVTSVGRPWCSITSQYISGGHTFCDKKEPFELITDTATARQSTTASRGAAANAVDGNMNQDLNAGSCAQTEGVRRNPWWQVQLVSKSFVVTVKIWNGNQMGFRLKLFELYLSKTVDHPELVQCPYDSSSVSDGEIFTVSCGMMARLVEIQIKGTHRTLSLCEVKVFGYPVGTWSPWSIYTSCSRNCGGGNMTRSRICNMNSQYCAGPSEQVKDCSTHSCPVGILSQWSNWASCSQTCGGGETTRFRHCNTEPQYCPAGDLEQVKICSMQICPLIGTWSQWSNFTSCSETCGGRGKMIRSRTCNRTQDAADCQGNAKQVKKCFVKPCSTKMSDKMDLLSLSFTLSLVVAIEIVSIILMCCH